MRSGRLRSLVVAAAVALAACATTQRSPAPTAGATNGSTGSGAPAASTLPGASGGPGTAGPAVSRPPSAFDDIALALEPFTRVDGSPLALAAPDDGTDRLFVATQGGMVWIVKRDGTVLPDPMLDLTSVVRSGGEQGLLGIAVRPQFPIDPRVFVDYTNVDGDTVVASLTLDPSNPDRLDPASLRQVLFVDQPFPNHNGGAVMFGPDGYLYISLGDGGGGGDPQGNGQDTGALLGKILRIDVDATTGSLAYAIPADNPFAAGGGRGEVWLYGLRNPWRTSFDRATADLWIGDVGQDAWEEVDVARAGVSGLNFGWNEMEGSHCYNAERCRPLGLTLPVADYGRDLGCTVIGGYVYRGTTYPTLVGAYVFADYCTGRLFVIDSASTGVLSPITVGGLGKGGEIAAFGEDVHGELYVVTLGGDISRIVVAPG